MKAIYISLILFVFIAMSSCENTTKKVEEIVETNTFSDENIVLTKQQFKNSKMELSSPELHIFKTLIQVNGKTQVPPTDRASLMAYAGGYIKSVYKQRGEYVQKGQTIASIENPSFLDLQKQYIEINKEVSVLKSELERQTALFEEQISAKKTFERTQADYENRVVEMKSITKELQLYGFSPQEVIKGKLSSIALLQSPINGMIEDLNIHLGQYVDPEDKIATIINTDNIHLELNIFEKDWYPLKVKQAVIFKFSGYAGDWHQAELELIGKSIDPNTRSVAVQAKILEPIENLVPGIFIEAKISTESQKTWALPETAFAQNESQNYVLKLEKEDNDNYYFSKHKIQVEIEDNGFKSFKEANQDTTAVYLSKGIFTILDFD